MSHQDDKDQDKDQDTPKGLSDIEESAFYESGLTAHGCIDNLDAYAMESIKRYGMILFKAAYKDYAGLMLDSKRLKDELEELNEELTTTKKKLRSVICHENDLMDSVISLQEEVKLLKAIMDVMKDKANE